MDRTVLVIGAHPDDEVLGAGGAIAKHTTAGETVHVLVVTEGATQQYDDDSMIDKKVSEARECADRLGVESVRFGELPDMRLDEVAHVELNAVIEETVDDVCPDVVYTHSDREVNLDHRAIHRSTMVATRPGSGVERVLTYEVPSSTDWVGGSERFEPNVYMDISGHLEAKIEAFRAYESETRKYPHPRSFKGVRARARSRGLEAGFEAAEAFQLVKSYRKEL
jgi:LmbE family N-acetylglucosaminyl deacetylase